MTLHFSQNERMMQLRQNSNEAAKLVLALREQQKCRQFGSTFDYKIIRANNHRSMIQNELMQSHSKHIPELYLSS